MAHLDVRVIPIGTQTAGVSEYIRRAVDVARQSGLSYAVTPTSTCLEGPLDRIVEVGLQMHEACFEGDVARVVTTLTIDDRRDQHETLEDKLTRVE